MSKCLYITTTTSAAEKHYKLCVLQEPATVEMPQQPELKFDKFRYHLSVPFVIYADIECVNIINQQPQVRSKTVVTAKQVPSCIYLRVKSLYPNLLKDREVLFKGEDCIKRFVKWLDNNSFEFENLLKTSNPYNLTNEELEDYRSSTTCLYCGLEVEKKKVIDHDHFTGDYRGAAHSSCNLLATKPKHVPVYFHNLSKYDLHLIVTELKTSRLKPIPLNEETYISYTMVATGSLTV